MFCKHCGHLLPRGILVGIYPSRESEEIILGPFCSIACTTSAVNAIPPEQDFPIEMSMGVKVDRQDHDDVRLTTILNEIISYARDNPDTAAIDPPSRTLMN